MPKKYTINKNYNKLEEDQIFKELKKVREQGIIIYQEDVPHTSVEYGILMKEPNPCFLQLTSFIIEYVEDRKISAVVIAANETKPEVVKNLEKILSKTAKKTDLK